jgi:hypothetical protein
MLEKMRLMVDGHVHVYDSYDLETFFKTASAYLDYFYDSLYANGSPYVKLLLLTESKTHDYFARWQEEGTFPNNSGFRFRETGEDTSLVLVKEDKPQCYLIRGRQIVTRENLEVLSVGSRQTITDGLPIETVIDTLIDNEEFAVLAWGFGKWLFKRGKVIARLLETYDSPYLLVGDNSGRPVFWPTPRQFKLAGEKNIPLISGSDPLPFPSETRKPGSFGFSVEGEFNPEEPVQSLRDILAAPGIDSRIDRFGYRDGVLSFFKRQSKIYLKKYLKK